MYKIVAQIAIAIAAMAAALAGPVYAASLPWPSEACFIGAAVLAFITPVALALRIDRALQARARLRDQDGTAGN